MSAILTRISEHFLALGEVFQELAECGSIRLDESAVLSPVGGVEMATEEPLETRRFVTVRDLAERLQVDSKTIRRWRDERRLPPAISVGGVVRWRPEVLDAWLAEQEEGP